MKIRLLVPTLIIASLAFGNVRVAAGGDHHGNEQSNNQEDNEQENEGEGHAGQCDNHDEDDDDQGGAIDGSECLDGLIILAATTNAPVGAAGIAKLKVNNESGTVTATLEIKTVGLAPGDYGVSIVKLSDGTSVDIGSVTVADSGTNITSDAGVQTGKSQGRKQFVKALTNLKLPTDLDPMDIAQIVLSDTAGTALLVGDVANPTESSVIKVKATIRVKSQNAGVGGKALALSMVKKGKRANRFTMIASGVPANTTFDVQVNGQSAGTARSNKKGKVLIKQLPSGVKSLQSVRLVDEKGRSAARAGF